MYKYLPLESHGGSYVQSTGRDSVCFDIIGLQAMSRLRMCRRAVTAPGRQGGAGQDGRAGLAGRRSCAAAKRICGTASSCRSTPAMRTMTVKTRLLRQAATDVERLTWAIVCC